MTRHDTTLRTNSAGVLLQGCIIHPRPTIQPRRHLSVFDFGTVQARTHQLIGITIGVRIVGAVAMEVVSCVMVWTV